MFRCFPVICLIRKWHDGDDDDLAAMICSVLMHYLTRSLRRAAEPLWLRFRSGKGMPVGGGVVRPPSLACAFRSASHCPPSQRRHASATSATVTSVGGWMPTRRPHRDTDSCCFGCPASIRKDSATHTLLFHVSSSSCAQPMHSPPTSSKRGSVAHLLGSAMARGSHRCRRQLVQGLVADMLLSLFADKVRSDEHEGPSSVSGAPTLSFQELARLLHALRRRR